MGDTRNPPLAVIVALMIGELRWQPRLNRISSAVVEHAVAVWKQHPSALLVCESGPMSALAINLGVPDASLITGLPEPSGHTTRRLALALQRRRRDFPKGRWSIVTHEMHARRAIRVFERCGLPVGATTVNTAFEWSDLDWKLKSPGIFRAYNLAAWVYCYARRWV